MKRNLKTLFVCALLGALATSALAQHQRGVVTHERFIPTPKDFGKPLALRNYAASGNRKGILDCDSLFINCRVMNMPLLHQEDPRVEKDLQYISPTGCYLASMATVIATALANRNPLFASAGRTKDFDSLAGDAAQPKEIKQLNYVYRVFKRYEKGETENGKRVQVFHFPEVVADFNKGKILQPCDPYVYGDCDKIGSTAQATNASGDAGRMWMGNGLKLTNENVISLMESGYVVMLAYARYQPVLELPNVSDKKKTPTAHNPNEPVNLFFNSYHKVVVSGFRKGAAYPLIINDVGTGQRYNVRLSTDWSNRKFKASFHVAPFQNAKFAFLPNEDPKTIAFIEYEGEGQGINDWIFFLNHYDYLRIKQ
ncbi:MAG: hypothetical protein M3209_08635 [Acidobacteriota bacterium]|nr:hypothetical protein [Acidobacteriota bacterium]